MRGGHCLLCCKCAFVGGAVYVRTERFGDDGDACRDA